MEIESRESIKQEENSKQPHLYYLSFIKFVAMVVIISWHIFPYSSKPIDFGARMCELLIVASGFLVGYNYFKRPMKADYKTSIKYVWGKFKVMWPLHVIVLALFIIRNWSTFTSTFTYRTLGTLLANFFLVQAWSNIKEIFFSFNSVSWYLSAILFCYFLSPLLLKLNKNKRLAATAFIIAAAVRIGFDYLNKVNGNIFGLNFHVNPVLRSMEFTMGLTFVPFYFVIKNYLNKFKDKVWFKSVYTVVEIAVPTGTYFMMWAYQNLMTRGTYALFFVLVVALVGLDYGYLSKLCSLKPFKVMYSVELEMYVPQKIINFYLVDLFTLWGWTFFNNDFFAFFVKVFIIFLIALLYKLFVEKYLAKGLDFAAKGTLNLLTKPFNKTKAA